MWGGVKHKDTYLEMAISFTGNDELYGEWMLHVVRDWKFSCEHNLSNRTQNRRAWIGHAACAYAFRCPEDIVRKAWSYLTEEQQTKANARADDAISKWEESCQR